jgi:predicted transcriptional regulator
MKKQEVVQLLNQFPDEVDTELLIETLYLRAKLERAEEAIERGEVLSHEEVVEESKKWFK